jgi:hypothetical protein
LLHSQEFVDSARGLDRGGSRPCFGSRKLFCERCDPLRQGDKIRRGPISAFPFGNKLRFALLLRVRNLL